MAKEYSRTQRVGGHLQRELASLIQQDLRDPRIGVVTVSSVEVSRDLGHAKIFVTFMDETQDIEEAVKALNKAAGFLRHLLGQRLVMRGVPNLHFVYDRSLEHGQRVTSLLSQVAAEHKSVDEK